MDTRQRSALLIAAALAAVLAAISIVTIDEPVARWLADRDAWLWDLGIDVISYAMLIEPWKWGGVVVLVAGVLLATRKRRAWMLVAMTHLLARNVMLWLKVLTGRLRPTEWLARGGHTFFRDGISFPSGHVMLCASIALPLALVWPRARSALYAVIAFVMIARVAGDAHFVSDVLAGFALVAAITALGLTAIAPPIPRASRQ